MCEALHVAHSAGLVHRDVKPENVLLTAHGEVKVVDFGIAAFTDAERTQPGGTMTGTLRYLSPEQAGGREATIASDIWAAGAVLSELLTGLPPLQGSGLEPACSAARPSLPSRRRIGTRRSPKTSTPWCSRHAPSRRPTVTYDASEMASELRRVGDPIAARRDTRLGSARAGDGRHHPARHGADVAHRGAQARHATQGFAI